MALSALSWLKSLIATHTAIAQRGGMFSIVSVCGCLGVFLNTITLEPFDESGAYHHEIVTRAIYFDGVISASLYTVLRIIDRGVGLRVPVS